jgi:hypothetical protein
MDSPLKSRTGPLLKTHLTAILVFVNENSATEIDTVSTEVYDVTTMVVVENFIQPCPEHQLRNKLGFFYCDEGFRIVTCADIGDPQWAPRVEIDMGHLACLAHAKQPIANVALFPL